MTYRKRNLRKAIIEHRRQKMVEQYVARRMQELEAEQGVDCTTDEECLSVDGHEGACQTCA